MKFSLAGVKLLKYKQGCLTKGRLLYMFYYRDRVDQRVETRNDSIIVHVITLIYCRINRDPMIMEDRQLI